MENHKIKQYYALAGLLAALLVGTGEFLIHFDPQGRFSPNGYDYMVDTPDSRLTLGHFFAMAGLPFYFVGLWYVYLQLRPGSQKLAFAGFVIASVGFLMGGVWMGSRATIASIVQHPDIVANTNLVELYQLRCESLLEVIRLTTLTFSVIYIYLILKGKTYYKKWMVFLNPILLLISNFILFYFLPEVGKYTMPIALNVAYFLFFGVSLLSGTKKSL